MKPLKNKDHSCIDQERTKSHIEQFGLSVLVVQSTEYLPSFAYSVGLQETYNHPEIILFGLKPEIMHIIINDVADLIKNGDRMEAGNEYVNIFKDNRAYFLVVEKRNIGDYFGVAIDYYGNSDFRALQLIWTDRIDKFPWEEGFEVEFRHLQPLLDRNADFKFREESNLCVFTTSDWLENNAPILRVVHDHDGDWQFLTGEFVSGSPKLVCLDDMIKRDPTLNDLFNLDYGEEAERTEVGGPWRRIKFEEEGD